MAVVLGPEDECLPSTDRQSPRRTVRRNPRPVGYHHPRAAGYPQTLLGSGTPNRSNVSGCQCNQSPGPDTASTAFHRCIEPSRPHRHGRHFVRERGPRARPRTSCEHCEHDQASVIYEEGSDAEEDPWPGVSNFAVQWTVDQIYLLKKPRPQMVQLSGRPFACERICLRRWSRREYRLWHSGH